MIMSKQLGHKDIKIKKLEKRIRQLEKAYGTEPSNKNKSKFYHNSWDENLDEVVATVKELSKEDDFTWSWARNWSCKYISIRIDMRDGAFVLVNGEGERISLDQLKYQYNGEDDE